MVYTPTINVLDATQIRANLISHFRDNQVEVLTWANGGTSLPPIKDFHISPRLVTIFPALTFLQIDHKTKWDENILLIDFSIVLETAIIHGNKDTLADRGPKYSMAIESMLANVPETTFNQDSIIEITSTGMGIETTFDVQGKYKTQYIEVFQTRANWQIEASAFAN